MKQIITKFDDETGDFDVVTPVPFTLNDGIEVLGMMVADIPKYEDTETYNVFDLIRENQELRKHIEEHNLATENLAYWKGKNESKMKINRLRVENKDLKDKLKATKEVAEEHLKKEIELKTQQKEFIEWLERNAKKYTPNLRVNVFDAYGNRIAQYINAEVYEIPPEDVVKEVLYKYKEIVGDNNE